MRNCSCVFPLSVEDNSVWTWRTSCIGSVTVKDRKFEVGPRDQQIKPVAVVVGMGIAMWRFTVHVVVVSFTETILDCRLSVARNTTGSIACLAPFYQDCDVLCRL